MTDLERDLGIMIKDWDAFWQSVDDLPDSEVFRARYSQQGERLRTYKEIGAMLEINERHAQRKVANVMRRLWHPKINASWIDRRLL